MSDLRSAEAMAMGKLHKEIGHLIVQSAEDTDRTDAQVIKVNRLREDPQGKNGSRCSVLKWSFCL